jgi:hypothetical protein
MTEASASRPTAVPAPKALTRWKLLALLILSLISFLGTTHKAFALEFGLMSADNAWQEERQWNVFQHSGATVYRLEISQGVYLNEGGWAKYNTAFRLAAERGITILPYLYHFGGTNGYSQRFPTKTEYNTPGSPWDAWTESVVRRYGYGGQFWAENPSIPYKPVTTWEVWNEPNFVVNNPLYWNGKEWVEKVQPTNYGEFLKHTVPVIRAAQAAQSPGSGTNVLFGGLTSVGEMSVGTFLETVHSTVASIGFNDLSLHPYALSTGQAGFEGNVNDARSKLNLFGASKALWITELGWAVGPTKGGNYVTEAEQESLLKSSFDWTKSNASLKNISLISWFDYRETTGFKSWADSTGLRLQAPASTFRKSWYAYLAETGMPSWVPPPEGAAPWVGWSGAYSADYADVNGDGKADLIGRYGENVQVALSTGTGFAAGKTWTNWASGYSADYADVNGDGKADLIGRKGTEIQTAPSTGSAFGAGSVWFNEWTSEYSANFPDVTGNGRADAVGRLGTDIEVASN